VVLSSMLIGIVSKFLRKCISYDDNNSVVNCFKKIYIYFSCISPKTTTLSLVRWFSYIISPKRLYLLILNVLIIVSTTAHCILILYYPTVTRIKYNRRSTKSSSEFFSYQIYSQNISAFPLELAGHIDALRPSCCPNGYSMK